MHLVIDIYRETSPQVVKPIKDDEQPVASWEALNLFAYARNDSSVDRVRAVVRNNEVLYRS